MGDSGFVIGLVIGVALGFAVGRKQKPLSGMAEKKGSDCLG